MIIPAHEIKLHPLSTGEDNARLFWWKGQLHRMIVPAKATLYRRLFEEGLVRTLVERGLMIESKLTDLETENCRTILWHRRLPFVSYPFEWCAAMLKSAAMRMLELEMELKRHDLMLQDAHPWNMLFEGAEPRFVDFESIATRRYEGVWPLYQTFCRYFLNPLMLMGKGQGHTARWLLFDREWGVGGEDVAALTGQDRPGQGLRRMARALVHSVPGGIGSVLWRRLARQRIKVAGLMDRAAGQPSTPEALYEQVKGMSSEEPANPAREQAWDRPPDHSAAHQRVLEAFFAQHPSQTVLDVGPSAGARAFLAARCGAQVVALDRLPQNAGRLYEQVLAQRAAVLPLVGDILNPWPGFGLEESRAMDAQRRLRCDTALAFGQMHRLVLRQSLTFEQVAAGLAGFCRKWLLVEFSTPVAASGDAPAPSWYTPQTFVGVMEKHFDQLALLPGASPDQPVLLGRKKPAATFDRPSLTGEVA